MRVQLHTLSKAQSVKLPPEFRARPEDPKCQPMITMVSDHNILTGELSVVVETMRVQSEDVSCQLPRAT